MAPKSKSPATGVSFAKNNFVAVLNNPLSTYPEEIQVMVKVLNNSFLKALSPIRRQMSLKITSSKLFKLRSGIQRPISYLSNTTMTPMD
jgi:hypothetical protein